MFIAVKVSSALPSPSHRMAEARGRGGPSEVGGREAGGSSEGGRPNCSRTNVFVSAAQHARKVRTALRVTALRKRQRNSDAWSQTHTGYVAERASCPEFAKAA